MSQHAKRLPNCIVIGAPRSGTTTLYEGLRRHPDIFMSPIKEPSYFAHHPTPQTFVGPGDERQLRWSTRTLDEYEALFAEGNGARIVGEASTIYFACAHAAAAMQAIAPGARLVAILRNPADRAYSHFAQHIQEGREPLRDFEAAIAQEQQRLEQGWSPFWSYVGIGYYAKHLAEYFKLFPRNQIGVFLYDDLARDEAAFVQNVYRFLEVDPAFDPHLAPKINASGQPRSQRAHAFLTGSHGVKRALKPFIPTHARGFVRNMQTRMANRNLVQAPPLEADVRRKLLDGYRDDIQELSLLLERDMTSWLGST